MVYKLNTSDILPSTSKVALTQHSAKASQATTPPTELWGLRLVIQQLSPQTDITVSYDWILKRVQRVLWTNRTHVTGS